MMEDSWPTNDIRENQPSNGRHSTRVHEKGHGGNNKESLLTDGGFRISEFLDILANRRRRYVLYYLRDEEQSTLDEIAEKIGDWEREAIAAGEDHQVIKDVRIDLYHVQLPKLTESGVIAFNHDDNRLCYNSPPGTFEEFLDSCAAIEWPMTDR